MISLGSIIRKLREEKGFSQRQLASLSGVSNTEISRIESSERKQPSQETLSKLAKCLSISYEELLVAAGYHITSAEAFNPSIHSPEQLIMENPELYSLWQHLRNREDLRALLKEAATFQPATIKQFIELLKLVEDKKTK